MPLLLEILFIVVPIAELAVLIQVGQLIGIWWTIALLIADAVLGSMLARSQGRAVWRRFNLALQSGRPPAREVLDGTLVLFGGALLLAPGFLTDILGIFLLLPPTRAFVRAVLVRRFMSRMVTSMTPGPSSPSPARQSYDVEGSAVDAPTAASRARRDLAGAGARPGRHRPGLHRRGDVRVRRRRRPALRAGADRALA